MTREVPFTINVKRAGVSKGDILLTAMLTQRNNFSA
jgi:hypothetical protein